MNQRHGHSMVTLLPAPFFQILWILRIDRECVGFFYLHSNAHKRALSLHEFPDLIWSGHSTNPHVIQLIRCLSLFRRCMGLPGTSALSSALSLLVLKIVAWKVREDSLESFCLLYLFLFSFSLYLRAHLFPPAH